MKKTPLKNLLFNSASFLGYVSAFAVAGCLSFSASAQSVANAQTNNQSETGTEDSILLQADEVYHDENLNIITAKGNVELMQNGRVLLADTLSYNQGNDTITASGDVKLLETTGEVLFAEYMELTDKMSKGNLHKIRVLLEDNARIAANGAKRFNPNRSEMVRAVYSPCDVCRDNPDADPLWQVKADKIVHDKEAKTLEYYNSWMEMAGIPVMYFPYLQTPDPSVDRASGILPPRLGADSDLGFFYQQPYFWAISEDKDATLEPIYTANRGVVLAGQYRQAFDSGNFEVEASIVDDSEFYDNDPSDRGHTRWHVDSFGRFDLTEDWRLGFDLKRQSDRLYLDEFAFWDNPDNTLDSQIFLEGFRERNYAKVETLYWQDLRTNPAIDQPTILPNISYHGMGRLDDYGGKWFLVSNLRHLEQSQASRSVRTSVKGGYGFYNTTDFGLETNTRLSIQGDIYQTDHEDNSGLNEDAQARFTPRISSVARMPFFRSTESGTQVIEPIAGIFVASKGGHDQDIRNDDSLVVEQDENSIFQEDMTPGIDRMETGTRASYGLRAAHYFDDGFELQTIFAQYYRFSEDATLLRETGIDDGASDYFGAFNIRPNSFLNFTYRIQVDRDNYSVNRNEASVRVGNGLTYLNASYTDVSAATASAGTAVDELRLSGSLQYDDFWRSTAYFTRDIDASETRYAGLSMIYEDECFIFDTTYRRDFTTNRAQGPSDTILFRFTFKTLGEFNQGLSN